MPEDATWDSAAAKCEKNLDICVSYIYKQRQRNIMKIFLMFKNIVANFTS